MERSFDLSSLLKKHEKKHKARPTQFDSMASGIKHRLQNNLKSRKSKRLSIFDSIRDLPQCGSPDKVVTNTLSKEQHRRQQLEKWKEEKNKKKKELAAQKKKPFFTGVAHAPLTYVPPPPPKLQPSTSGRVTRSQAARDKLTNKTEAANTKTKVVKSSQSFAPKNASFKPPDLLHINSKMPKLAQINLKRCKNTDKIVFEPILTNNSKSKSNPDTKKVANVKQTNIQAKKDTGKKGSNIETRKPHDSLTSSSSTEFETTSEFPRLKNRPSRKSVSHNFEAKSSKEYAVNSIILKGCTVTINRNVLSTNVTPKSESCVEERLRSPKSPELLMTPEQISQEAKTISPCVTLSRGKDNARREMKKKLEEGLLQEDISKIDSIEHFRRQLDSEISRMTGVCEYWEKIGQETIIPDHGQEVLLGAVGQARLLMSQKLQQFAALVTRCERPEPGSALVTPADLHGFWDMVFMQVENVNMRFKNLEELHAGGWAEKKPVEIKLKQIKPQVKKVKPAVASSKLRNAIAAARKATKQQPVEVEKTFEAGFFCIKSPVRRSTNSTPRRHSLLKAVLSSEAQKASGRRDSASFAMLRASALAKNVDIDGITHIPPSPVPMTPINVDATPSRSILKPVDETGCRKSGKKSIKVVLFTEDCDADSSFNILLDDPLKSTTDLKPDNNILPGRTDKENTRTPKLCRQNAFEERSPVMTRSRRRSLMTPREIVSEIPDIKKCIEDTPKRSGRKKKALQELKVNNN